MTKCRFVRCLLFRSLRVCKFLSTWQVPPQHVLADVVSHVLTKVCPPTHLLLMEEILYPSYTAKFMAADIMNVISAILCAILLITYFVLPSSSQANYPKICLAISLFMLNGAGFFTITPAVRNLTLCNDAISSANYTNWRCML